MNNESGTTALVPVEGDRLPVATEPPKKSYWGRVAKRYTALWRILLLVLILFAVLFMLLFSRAFTYDSIFCFFRDLQTVSAFVQSDHQTVTATYEEGEQTVLSYRGGIAFVNRGGVEVYSPDGRRLLDISRTLEHPRAVSSRKYLVAYEMGGKHFSVTNSYAELYRGETEFPIYGVTVADSGHFALITGSNTNLSQVLLYDNNFNLIQRFHRASATVGVGLTDNGKRIALLGANADEGTVYSMLTVFTLGEKEEEFTLTFENEMPLAVGFTDARHLAVLTDRALRFCDPGGQAETVWELNGADPTGFTVTDTGVLLTLEQNALQAEQKAVALDKRGHIRYEGSFRGEITALAMEKEAFYLLSGHTLTRTDLQSGAQSTVEVEAGADGIFLADEGVRVIYAAKAVFYQFETE